MISQLDSASQSFLLGMEQIQQRGETAQRQLTTGLKINSVSDAPDQISSLWQTRSELDQTQQIDTNLALVKSEVDTSESALQSAVSLMDRAQTLGAQVQPQGVQGRLDCQVELRNRGDLLLYRLRLLMRRRLVLLALDEVDVLLG